MIQSTLIISLSSGIRYFTLLSVNLWICRNDCTPLSSYTIKRHLYDLQHGCCDHISARRSALSTVFFCFGSCWEKSNVSIKIPCIVFSCSSSLLNTCKYGTRLWEASSRWLVDTLGDRTLLTICTRGHQNFQQHLDMNVLAWLHDFVSFFDKSEVDDGNVIIIDSLSNRKRKWNFRFSRRWRYLCWSSGLFPPPRNVTTCKSTRC